MRRVNIENDATIHWCRAGRRSRLQQDQSPSKISAATRNRISNDKSLAFIGSASARDDRPGTAAGAEALSITRLEGSRWRGGRLWSRKPGSGSGARLDRVRVAETGRVPRPWWCDHVDGSMAPTGLPPASRRTTSAAGRGTSHGRTGIGERSRHHELSSKRRSAAR